MTDREKELESIVSNLRRDAQEKDEKIAFLDECLSGEEARSARKVAREEELKSKAREMIQELERWVHE